ncbi:MAG: hypothetical protein ACW985_11500 [Candidatus Thorarchaeota archaeon]|jgi:hypothetical protein
MADIEGKDLDPHIDLKSRILQASEESSRILTGAKRRNAVLRLVGGLAIHVHCAEHHFCDRSHGDMDFVGLSSQYESIVQVMKEAEYIENTNMTVSTGGSRLLFEKPGAADHIDVFLDRIDIEHEIDLKDRLEIEKDTISVSDLLLLKLTITRLNEKDIRDIITMVKDLQMGKDDSPGTINIAYIADLCAKSWGLHHDVTASVRRTLDYLPRYSLPEIVSSEVVGRLRVIEDAILKATKSLRWKLRALLGERVSWRREIETTGVKLAGAPTTTS